ncbi:LPXTG cell wall anchor domain-containing protein [Streptomyces sp. M-16]|uniref:LPXTG cell wall anchor domain-containing protein n=1 Tax=Streptomyces sp. M-16 TaxID=3233040 RepID=UPI003F9B3BFA
MSRRTYEDHGTGDDPTAVPAAAGLALLAVGGWLLTTARPWQKPGHPLTLALGWTLSGALLVSGLVLLTRCVRAVHDAQDAPQGPGND